jgi:hypothetical protein
VVILQSKGRKKGALKTLWNKNLRPVQTASYLIPKCERTQDGAYFEILLQVDYPIVQAGGHILFQG